MNLKALAYFLILLLALAPVDDLGTPSALPPSGNVTSDEGGDHSSGSFGSPCAARPEGVPSGADGAYVPAPPLRHGRRSPQRGMPPLTGPAPALTVLPVPPRTVEAPVTLSQARPGPCLYVFMALLR